MDQYAPDPVPDDLCITLCQDPPLVMRPANAVPDGWEAWLPLAWSEDGGDYDAWVMHTKPGEALADPGTWVITRPTPTPLPATVEVDAAALSLILGADDRQAADPVKVGKALDSLHAALRAATPQPVRAQPEGTVDAAQDTTAAPQPLVDASEDYAAVCPTCLDDPPPGAVCPDCGKAGPEPLSPEERQ